MHTGASWSACSRESAGLKPAQGCVGSDHGLRPPPGMKWCWWAGTLQGAPAGKLIDRGLVPGARRKCDQGLYGYHQRLPRARRADSLLDSTRAPTAHGRGQGRRLSAVLWHRHAQETRRGVCHRVRGERTSPQGDPNVWHDDRRPAGAGRLANEFAKQDRISAYPVPSVTPVPGPRLRQLARCARPRWASRAGTCRPSASAAGSRPRSGLPLPHSS
jgi:hypothetical protein